MFRSRFSDIYGKSMKKKRQQGCFFSSHLCVWCAVTAMSAFLPASASNPHTHTGPPPGLSAIFPPSTSACVDVYVNRTGRAASRRSGPEPASASLPEPLMERFLRTGGGDANVAKECSRTFDGHANIKNASTSEPSRVCANLKG